MKTFKKWFALMWGDNWIQLFLVGVLFGAVIIIERDTIDSLLWFWIILSIPILICVAIIFGAFIKLWKTNKDKL